MTHPAHNKEQRDAISAVQHGKSIFLTGAGGTGKSYTIRAITEWAAAAGIRCSVTALTGCAALLLGLGAKTLHSWAGIGLAKGTPQELLHSVKQNRRAVRRWIETQLLVVDEVSMMTPDLLEKLDFVARRIRKRLEHPMGGMQIVFSGDFCQLPPVQKQDVSGSATAGIFAFESPTWDIVIQEIHELREIIRQVDPVFQRVLTEARMGALSPDSIGTLESRMGLSWQENDIRPTLIFTRNAEVDAINRKNIEALDGEARIFEADTVATDRHATERTTLRIMSVDDPDIQQALEKLDSDAPYMRRLELRVGAQVMLLINMDQDRGLVNGSRGVLTGYTPGGLPVVRFLSVADPVIVDRAMWWLTDYDGIGRSQIPLRVAYAVTTHRSQGSTLDSALIDIGSSTFEFGQAYVALSRVRSLTGLYVWKFDPRKVICHPRVLEFYGRISAAARTEPSGPADPDPTESAESTDAWAPIADPHDLSPTWSAIVIPFLASPIGQRLRELLTARMSAAPIAPSPESVFAAICACPDPTAVRVVILAQDPYPTPGHAHGLAFSVRPSITKLPPSLQNIYKELTSDLGIPAPVTGSLQSWADQGVLLLNDVLTVTHGAPQSHSGLGWEVLTTQLLASVLETAEHVVIMAWGRFAQKKLSDPLIRTRIVHHTVLTAPHPSPLSAHTGFFGSRPFSQANAALVAHGQEPICWAEKTDVSK